MNGQIKEALREMLKDGELKIEVEWESLWSELHVKVIMDGETLVQESTVIKVK